MDETADSSQISIAVQNHAVLLYVCTLGWPDVDPANHTEPLPTKLLPHWVGAPGRTLVVRSWSYYYLDLRNPRIVSDPWASVCGAMGGVYFFFPVNCSNCWGECACGVRNQVVLLNFDVGRGSVTIPSWVELCDASLTSLSAFTFCVRSRWFLGSHDEINWIRRGNWTKVLFGVKRGSILRV